MSFNRPAMPKRKRPPFVPLAEPAHAVLRRADGNARLLVQVPKGPPAKPGKTAPTAEESRWMSAIVGFGCIACRIDRQPPRPAAVHHILRGGVRMGHLWTIPLCDPGHHKDGTAFGLISRHPDKARFEDAYGTEAQLLLMVRAEIANKREII